MRSKHVTLNWNNRPRIFERDILDTAWLIMQDYPIPLYSEMSAKMHITHRLDELGYQKHISITYAVAVFQYDPDM